ncbi:MAG: hypothetical protein RL226_1152 [Bacteroidota bacterium]|jgi:biopolymer transport protein ExbD
MARREIPEINAGSMADIAFLLLIFWLVTTTIDSDEGIRRQLPPPIPPDMLDNQPEVIQRNVFVVLVNANNNLLVEGQELRIGQLKEKAKEFLIANGDGVLYGDLPENKDLPVRSRVSKAELKQLVDQYEGAVKNASDDDTKDKLTKVLEDYRAKLAAVDLLGGEYKILPPSALISMRNDNNTSYDTYIQVQNELEAAVAELRDELSEAKFGISYKELEDKFEKNPDDQDLLMRISAVREVYPQRISEAEPEDASGY